MKLCIGLLLPFALSLPTSPSGSPSSGANQNSVPSGNLNQEPDPYNQWEDLSSEEGSYESKSARSNAWIPRREDEPNQNDVTNAVNSEDGMDPNSKMSFFTPDEFPFGSETSSINSDRNNDIPRVTSFADSLKGWVKGLSTPQNQLPAPPQQSVTTATGMATTTFSIPTEVATPLLGPANPRNQRMIGREIASRLPNAPLCDSAQQDTQHCSECANCKEFGKCCYKAGKSCLLCPCEVANMYQQCLSVTRETVNAIKEAVGV